MATTTAAVTLTSDLMQDALSVNTDTTLMKAGTTADGLDQVRMGYNKIATGTSFDVIDAKTIGRLYAGDWMFIPWNQDDATHDLEITATTGTNLITWMAIHEGETLGTQAD